MNLDDIKTRIFRTFGDEDGIQITIDDVIRWVSDAQREIAITADLAQTVATNTTIVGGTPLPANMLTLHGVNLVVNAQSTLPLKSVTFTEGQNLLNNSGLQVGSIPEVYWIYGNTLFVYPDVVSTIKIFYTREPVAPTVLAPALDLPVSYHTRILEYCLKEAYELDENFEAMALKGAEMDKNLETQQNQVNLSNQQQYPFISVSPSDL